MWAWIFGIVGALGFAGTVALVILAPAVAQGVFKVVGSALQRVWATRTGMALIVAVAVAVLAFPFGDRVGAARVTARWATANAIAADKAREADNLAAAHAEFTDKRDTAAEADADATTAEARNAYIADLESQLAKRPAGAGPCTDGVDLGRLRDIR